MTRRTARSRSRGAAALTSLVLLLAACGGSTDDAARGAGASASLDAQGTAPAEGERAAVDRTAPGATAAAYFEAVRDARFGDACSLIAPVVLAPYASDGKDCQTELSALFDERTRAAIGDVTADESMVQVVGDTATAPGSALSRTDLPAGAAAPLFPDIRATRQGGIWYLVPD